MDDKIFLLSKEEYKTYQDVIPTINLWWWLRSPGYKSNRATGVDYGGFVRNRGNFVTYGDGAVRPALRVDEYFEIGQRIIVADYPWIVVDSNLAIAETPIAFRRFDEKSNNYETSEIRQFLLDWYKERMKE